MDDLINRQAAIDAVKDAIIYNEQEYAEDALMSLPSVTPPKGEWINERLKWINELLSFIKQEYEKDHKYVKERMADGEFHGMCMQDGTSYAYKKILDKWDKIRGAENG